MWCDVVKLYTGQGGRKGGQVGRQAGWQGSVRQGEVVCFKFFLH